MLNGATFIDFSRGESSPLVEFSEHMRVGDVTVARCIFSHNSGTVLGSPQLVIALQSGEPYHLETGYGNFRKEQSIRSGMMNIWAANSPAYQAWGDANPRMVVVAVEQQMVSKILTTAGLGSNDTLPPRFGIRDKTISQLAKTCSDQLEKGGTTNKAFMDGLSTALVTHIYRTYSENVSLDFAKGGLTPIDAQRVLKFIEQNLQENIGLEQLASTVQLSTHYFTEAFRKTVGMPPYRFLLTRRIEKAKDLLLHSDLAPGKIAAEVGFSSQAQFTTNFRKLVGKTPGRFRREAT